MVWTSTSVRTPFSASQRAGGVTDSRTVPTSPMKSFVPLWCPVLFLLRTAVLMDVTSVRMVPASPPYCDVTVSQTAPMERTSTAAVSICLCQVEMLTGAVRMYHWGKSFTSLWLQVKQFIKNYKDLCQLVNPLKYRRLGLN